MEEVWECTTCSRCGHRILPWRLSISRPIYLTHLISTVTAESAYYDLDIVQWYLRNMSMGGARGVAFSVLGYKVPFAPFAKSWQCSGVPTNYLSFVIIDKVEPGDNETELMVNVTSFTGESMQGDYAIHASMCFSVYIKIINVCT